MEAQHVQQLSFGKFIACSQNTLSLIRIRLKISTTLNSQKRNGQGKQTLKSRSNGQQLIARMIINLIKHYLCIQSIVYNSIYNIYKSMQKKTKQKNFEQMQNEIEKSQSQESSSDDGQLRQSAFPLQINSECSEGQKAAIQYLFQVREQACKFKQMKSNKRVIVEEKQSNIMVTQIRQESILKQASWFNQWEKQVLEHWKCVIANIKYLIGKKSQVQLRKPKINIKSQPKIKQLVNSLVLPQIQNSIVDLCQQYLESQHQSKNKHSFYLWIFALLALHQSRAQYTMFEALASINSCIFGQSQQTPEMLSVFVILKQHFSQHHLAKKINKY